MRVLVLYAHPVETSFCAAIHAAVLEGLAEAGHEVDDCDLYAEGFDPVMPRSERLAYHDIPANRAPVEVHLSRLEAAEALVTVSPIWNFGVPAILKGYLDRVFLPGVTFRLEDGVIRPAAVRFSKLACVHTYGAKRWHAWAVGDPPRRQLLRIIGGLCAKGAPRRYLGFYDMNTASEARRKRFIVRIRREFAAF